MNRAERRRLKRNQESGNATYTLRNEDVTRIKQDAAQEAIDKDFMTLDDLWKTIEKETGVKLIEVGRR